MLSSDFFQQISECRGGLGAPPVQYQYYIPAPRMSGQRSLPTSKSAVTTYPEGELQAEDETGPAT